MPAAMAVAWALHAPAPSAIRSVAGIVSLPLAAGARWAVAVGFTPDRARVPTGQMSAGIHETRFEIRWAQNSSPGRCQFRDTPWNRFSAMTISAHG
jgi:hypothetical protein